MSAVTGVLQDLVRRRLWPFALLLVVAAVAAPTLLATDAEPVAAPVTNAGPPEAQPIASLVDTFSADARRRVLGVAKDPFAPSGRQPKPAKSVSPLAASDSTTGGSLAGGADVGSPALGGSGGSAAGGSSPVGGASPGGDLPGPVVPVPTPAPGADDDTTYALHSLEISWDEGPTRELARLAPLPDAETPAVIYLGLLSDAKTAVFLLDDGVTSEGDGSCHPSPRDCQRVHLKKGETQFFDVNTGSEDGAGVGTQHQLDLVDINTERTASASKARKVYVTASKAGRRALRARSSRTGRWRYDARTGLLSRISVQAHRAAIARAASSVAAR